VKMLIWFSTIFVLLVFSGCCEKELIVDTVEVKVPVVQKCPQPVCDSVEKLQGLNNVELLQSVVTCSAKRKEALNACR